MNPFKAIWHKIRPSKKIKRQLPLIHVHTFSTGEKLYTYHTEDWGKIGSRYYRAIQDASNYLKNFLLTENEWKSAVDALIDIVDNSLNSNKTIDRTRALTDIKSTLLWFKDKTSGLKNANEVLLEFMFCMFYLLEEEQEMGYSPIHNKRKIELLNEDQEVRDFFLSNLKQNTGDLSPISREDSLTLLIRMEQMKGAMTFLNLQED